MEKEVKRVVLDLTYEGLGEIELYPGSGGGTPGPDSVGTEQIINSGVKEEDLDDDVKAGLDELNNITITDDELGETLFPGGIPEDVRERMEDVDDAEEEE
jgi:hypothetical protein